MLASYTQLRRMAGPCTAAPCDGYSPTQVEAPQQRQRQKLSVAVIGAGAGGLVAARELLKEGHRVAVFEQESEGVGGVWRYSPQVEAEDLLGLSPDRPRIHSSMYRSLRINLPREIMGFLDFPFLPKHHDPCRDPRRYPGHAEVLFYLQDYASHFDLLPHILFGRRVTSVSIHNPRIRQRPPDHPFASRFEPPIRWSVTTVTVTDCMNYTDIFDAVIICNGHYFQPKLPSISCIDKWPGIQLHSHNYRVPEPFVNQIVVVIGNSSSGSDISREIATVAKEVHLVGRTWDSSVDLKKPAGALQNIFLHPMVKSAHGNGELFFEDGYRVLANVIIYCTGYAFSVPFLETQGAVNIDINYIGPLYKHVFPPQFAPTLAFVGLPFKVVPFPLMQLQTKWIAQILSGKVSLPSAEQIFKDVEKFYKALEANGIPHNRVHDLSSYQFQYENWLADQCSCQGIEDWRMQIYINSSKAKRDFPDTYRDKWSDQELHDIAVAELQQLKVM